MAFRVVETSCIEEESVLSMELVDDVFSKYCEGMMKRDILEMMEQFGLIGVNKLFWSIKFNT